MGVRAEIEPFFRDIPRHFSEAQLVISRAGASSIADLSIIGRPSILVPFAAAANDHQSANARGLVEAGAAVLLPESQFTPENVAEQITLILSNPDGAAQMARMALGQGMPEATENLVNMVLELATPKENTQ